jgi:hypothetical protein
MKKQIFFLAAALIALTVTACGGGEVSVTTPTPTVEEPRVVIAVVDKDEQYVVLRNDCDIPQDLGNWYLSLGRGLECLLGEGLLLQPGETLQVWALATDAGRGGYNCGCDEPFWSRREPERVFLYDADGELVDRYFGGQD